MARRRAPNPLGRSAAAHRLRLLPPESPDRLSRAARLPGDHRLCRLRHARRPVHLLRHNQVQQCRNRHDPPVPHAGRHRRLDSAAHAQAAALWRTPLRRARRPRHLPARDARQPDAACHLAARPLLGSALGLCRRLLHRPAEAPDLQVPPDAHHRLGHARGRPTLRARLAPMGLHGPLQRDSRPALFLHHRLRHRHRLRLLPRQPPVPPARRDEHPRLRRTPRRHPPLRPPAPHRLHPLRPPRCPEYPGRRHPADEEIN